MTRGARREAVSGHISSCCDVEVAREEQPGAGAAGAPFLPHQECISDGVILNTCSYI